MPIWFAALDLQLSNACHSMSSGHVSCNIVYGHWHLGLPSIQYCWWNDPKPHSGVWPAANIQLICIVLAPRLSCNFGVLAAGSLTRVCICLHFLSAMHWRLFRFLATRSCAGSKIMLSLLSLTGELLSERVGHNHMGNFQAYSKILWDKYFLARFHHAKTVQQVDKRLRSRAA